MALGDFLAKLGGGGPAAAPPAPAPSTPAAPTRDDLGAALDRVESMVGDGAVPSCVTARVERVTHVVRDTIPRLGAIRGSASAYSVVATATDYLPEALGGYLRLPRRFADSRPVDGGRTSLMVLVDQLDLLGATMDQVFDAVCRDDATALVAHGRFLAEKFGHASTGGELNVGTAYAVPPPPDALAEAVAAPTPAAPLPEPQTPAPLATSSPAPPVLTPDAQTPQPTEPEPVSAAGSGPEAGSAPAAPEPARSEESVSAEPAPTAPPRSLLDLDDPAPGSMPPGPPEPQRLTPPTWP